MPQSVPVLPRAAVWLVCLSPLVWIPGGFDRFVFPKLLLAVAAIACAALGPRWGRVPKPVLLVAAAGVGWFALACLLSPTPVASLVGRWPRYEGLPVVLTYAGCAWAGARLLGSRHRVAVEELFRALPVTSVLLAAASVLGELGWSIEGKSVESRAGSLLGNATDQGIVAMILFAVLFPVAVDRRTPLLVAGAAAAPVVVLLSGSRAALLALVVVAALQVVLRRRDLVRYAGGGAVGLGLLALALPQVRDRIGDSATVTGRWLLWEDSLEVARGRWFSGGPSTFVDTVGKVHGQDWVREVGPRNPPDSPHSWPLQALVSGGVPLLLLALALAATVLVVGWQALRARTDALTLGAFTAVVGYGIALLPNFTIAGSTCLAAFLVGVLVGEKVGNRAGNKAGGAEVRWPVQAVLVLACVGGLVFSAATIGERSLTAGVTAANAGDLVAADDAFSQARTLRPLDGDVAMFAAQSFAGAANAGVQGAAELAVTWAQRSLDRTPDTYHSGLALAVAQIALGDLPAAETTLDRLVELYPTEPGARIQRGLARFGQRDVAGARNDLTTAIDLDPDDTTAAEVLAGIEARLAEADAS